MQYGMPTSPTARRHSLAWNRVGQLGGMHNGRGCVYEHITTKLVVCGCEWNAMHFSYASVLQLDDPRALHLLGKQYDSSSAGPNTNNI